MSTTSSEDAADTAGAPTRERLPAVGIAGWSVRREHDALFSGQGTHLARYAGRFAAVELNSSFYRPHRRQTYERWAASVPEDFRFSVKMPREITHDLRLIGAVSPLEGFLDNIAGLGRKLGPILIQLPPTMDFEASVVGHFLEALRTHFKGPVVLEPRHSSWFEPPVESLLCELEVARVAADPAVVASAAQPAGCPRPAYFRLHGSPQMYTSPYSGDYLDALALRLASDAGAWCIFDNTKFGAAVSNAIALIERLRTLCDDGSRPPGVQRTPHNGLPDPAAACQAGHCPRESVEGGNHDAERRQEQVHRQAEAPGRAHRGRLREEGRQREGGREPRVGDRQRDERWR